MGDDMSDGEPALAELKARIDGGFGVTVVVGEAATRLTVAAAGGHDHIEFESDRVEPADATTLVNKVLVIDGTTETFWRKATIDSYTMPLLLWGHPRLFASAAPRHVVIHSLVEPPPWVPVSYHRIVIPPPSFSIVDAVRRVLHL